MITFEFDSDTTDNGLTWVLSCTNCIGIDEQHSNEIYQQLDAMTVGWA